MLQPQLDETFPVKCPKCHIGVRLEGTHIRDHGRYFIRYTCDHSLWDDWNKTPIAPPSERCVITFNDTAVIITNYHNNNSLPVPVTPTRALQIARDLLGAALELHHK